MCVAWHAAVILSSGPRLSTVGRDSESFEELCSIIKDAIPEDECYRIDHYLAKGQVENLLTLRFSNVIFERASLCGPVRLVTRPVPRPLLTANNYHSFPTTVAKMLTCSPVCARRLLLPFLVCIVRVSSDVEPVACLLRHDLDERGVWNERQGRIL
jgi:Glucose-6-phosphate dehydrogenase, NAD binding domain